MGQGQPLATARSGRRFGGGRGDRHVRFHVLSTQPKDFVKLLSTDAEKLSNAFSAGVGVPYFLTDSSFKNALAELQVAWDDKSPVSDSQLTRTVAATEALREWVLQNELARSFRTFRNWFAFGALLIVVGFVVTTTTLGPPPGVINQPEVVRVTVSQAGAKDLLDSTGCTKPMQTEFLAIAGTWEAPVLETVGPGCKVGTMWRPNLDAIEVRLPPVGYRRFGR